jgi:hypothetical protein
MFFVNRTETTHASKQINNYNIDTKLSYIFFYEIHKRQLPDNIINNFQILVRRIRFFNYLILIFILLNFILLKLSMEIYIIV